MLEISDDVRKSVNDELVRLMDSNNLSRLQALDRMHSDAINEVYTLFDVQENPADKARLAYIRDLLDEEMFELAYGEEWN